MTPSLPTLSMASAMIVPISSSLLAATEATFCMSCFDLDVDLHVLSLVDDVFDGLFDAALHEHRVGAGDDRLESFVVDRLGENRRRRGAVAGHVAGLVTRLP